MGLIAFPVGVAPGFDPSHIAARSATLCAVASGGNFVDMLTGKPGTITGAPTANISGIIGPNVKFGGGTDNVAIAGKRFYGANAAPLADTMAAIVIMNSAAAQQAFLSLATSGVGASYSWLGTMGVNTISAIFKAGNPGLASTWAGSVSVPLFVATSQNLSAASAATQTANIVVCRLDTGQMYANTASQTGSGVGSRDGTYNIGSRGAASVPSTANIAAAMASDAFLPLALLTQWAADPWSFWYPR